MTTLERAPERRRDRRYPVLFTGIMRQSAIMALTENVSYHGMLLSVDAPVVLGQLYCLEVMATRDSLVRLYMVPVRRVIEAQRWSVGVRLLGSDPRWERIVAELQAARGGPPPSPSGPAILRKRWEADEAPDGVVWERRMSRSG
jgi:hypothetical protein